MNFRIRFNEPLISEIPQNAFEQTDINKFLFVAGNFTAIGKTRLAVITLCVANTANIKCQMSFGVLRES